MKDYYTHYPRTILWLIPGGEATLGGPEAADPPQFVAEVEPFYLGKFPITNEQFEAFAPEFQRSATSAGDRDPAVGVSLEEARAYAAWYARVSRKPMRLPTEVEWEYACRAGASGPTFFAADEDPTLYLWSRENSGAVVPPLDGKKANGFGLFAMLGGVWEWASPPYGSSPGAEAGEGGEPLGVLRGGSFRTPRALITCSLRRAAGPGERFDDAGFRLARSMRR